MKKSVIYIFSLLMSATLLISSVGVSINHHVCGMNGKHIVSLYVEKKCDTPVKKAVHSCCSGKETTSETSCCSTHSDQSKQTAGITTIDHCKSFNETYSIDISFLANDLSKVKLLTASLGNSIDKVISVKQIDKYRLFVKETLENIKTPVSAIIKFIIKLGVPSSRNDNSPASL